MHRETEQREADELASGPDAEGRDDDGGGDADDERLAAWIEPHVQESQQPADDRDGDVRQGTDADRVQQRHLRAVLKISASSLIVRSERP